MEDDIIQRAQRGDQRAFQQLVEGYSDLAWRTARVLLAERAAAEDAVQEAWLDTWRGLPRFQLARPFRPWFLTLVANRCHMAARRHNVATTPLDDVDANELAGADDIHKHLLAVETGTEVRAMLATLSIEQQRVLELRFFADLDLEEIALVTGTPLGTVKSRLHRALGSLRAQLQVTQLSVAPHKEKDR